VATRAEPERCHADPALREKHPCSLSLDAERKRQLQTRRGGFARPKARRAQDDRRPQIRNSGLAAIPSNGYQNQSADLLTNRGLLHRLLGWGRKASPLAGRGALLLPLR